MATKRNIYDFPNVGCLLGTAYQMQVAQLMAALKDASLDILPAEYMILRSLYSYGRMQQCEISRLIGKDKGAVSRTVTAMIRKDLVKADQVSYKCLMVSLSPKGEAIRDAVMAVADKCQKSLSDIISDDEMAALERMLNKIINQK